ncbi:unnamed protein product, partial [Rotaria sp. Silwood2]
PLTKSNEPNDSNMNINLSSSSTKPHQVDSLTQLILSLDIEQWENLVDVFHIQTSMINDNN